MKAFRITPNGFIKVQHEDGSIDSFFYSTGCEEIWLEAGYKRVQGKLKMSIAQKIQGIQKLDCNELINFVASKLKDPPTDSAIVNYIRSMSRKDILDTLK